MVSQTTSYILWLVFGLLGLHHFYLRRYRHGFVWLCTIGGFGYGWLRDFIRLGDYIKEAKEEEKLEVEEEKNGTRSKKKEKKSDDEKEEEDEEGEEEEGEEGTVIIQSAGRRKKTKKKPPKSSWTRSTGQVTFAVILDVTFRSAIPEELLEENFWLKYCVNLAAAIFTAIGIHIVGNIGRHSLDFKWCLGPSILGNLLCPPDSDRALYGVVGATIVAEWRGKGWRQWRRQRRSKASRLKPMLIVAFAFGVYLALWGCGLWFNTYITTDDGEKVKLKDAVENFFKSPAWQEMRDTLVHLYEYVKAQGLGGLYREFIKALDPEGESNAYKVLGLSSGATATQIKGVCRKLSRQYHPDKVTGEEAKLEAEAKFIEVQGACQVLDKLRARRIKNSRSSVEL